MGDNAIRWALQQTQFSPVAQILLVRLCKHLDDRRPIWSWRKTLAVIADELGQTSVDTINRYCCELEGKDKRGQPLDGVTPVLFRGFNDGRATEYIILGPQKTATAAYIAEVYPREPQVENPPQLAVGQVTASCGDSTGNPPQVAVGAPQLAVGHLCSNSFSSSSPVDFSNTKQGPNQLVEIWKRARDQIRTRIDPQRCFTWFDPAEPVIFQNGVLTFAVPNAFFSDRLGKPDEHRLILEAVREMGLPAAREITFVVAQRKAATVRAGRAP